MNIGSCARLAKQQVRNIYVSSIACNRKTSHYDSLGITPKATQADVKSAYYELSKVYHPDRNKGSGEGEAAQKFRDISEAYEVLGNVKSRKLYDKGMAIGTNLGSTAASSDRMHKFYEEREKRTRPSTSGGRQPIYDFDEWSRMHYGATFARDMENKRRKRMMEKREVDFKNTDKMERFIMVVGVLLALCMYGFFVDDDFDRVEIVGNSIVRVPPD